MTPIIDQQFYAPRTPVAIAALPGADEVAALRALLEMLACVVTVHWIGVPDDFLMVLGQGLAAPRYLLIAGHGDDQHGYYFGEYAPDIDTSLLTDGYLPAERLAAHIDLPGCTVLSSACWGGTEQMGRAFTAAGRIQAYVGCAVDPEAQAMHIFLVNFFYQALANHRSDRSAWQRAMLATDHADIYQMRFYCAP